MVAVIKRTPKIELVLRNAFNVAPVVRALNEHPELWNRHTLRTQNYQGPHAQVSDIWVRYNAWENFDGDREKFNDAHESSWYPSADALQVKSIIFGVMALMRGTRLGGVLITKIPAHGQCLPHVDRGWHATYYEKFAVSIAANEQQKFCFDGEQLVTGPGDLFTFRNEHTHWVTNDSDQDRITLICCLRRD